MRRCRRRWCRSWQITVPRLIITCSWEPAKHHRIRNSYRLCNIHFNRHIIVQWTISNHNHLRAYLVGSVPSVNSRLRIYYAGTTSASHPCCVMMLTHVSFAIGAAPLTAASTNRFMQIDSADNRVTLRYPYTLTTPLCHNLTCIMRSHICQQTGFILALEPAYIASSISVRFASSSG